MKLQTIVSVALSLWVSALAVPVWAQAANDPYQAIIKREFGTHQAELAAIEEIHDARPEQYAAIEGKLLAVLGSAEATLPAKQFVCQMLRTVGSSKCIPAISALLTDEMLSHIARNALTGMPDASVDEALLKALGTTQGSLRIGIINTMGDRGAAKAPAGLMVRGGGAMWGLTAQDRQLVDALVPLAGSDDETTAAVTLNALGKIGGPYAADALGKMRVRDSLKDAWAQAWLRCATTFAAAGEIGRAESMLQTLLKPAYSLPVRAAAFPALAKLQKERAVPMVIAMLSSPEPIMRRAAIGAAIAIPGNAATRELVTQLPALAPEPRAALLGLLAARGDAEGATDAVNKLAADENAEVRLAAVRALARLGNAASVTALAGAMKDRGALAAEATRSLVDLQADGVAAALITLAETGDAGLREGIFGVLAQRRQVDAVPAVRKAVGDADANVRRAAMKTLGALGSQEDQNRLLEMLLTTSDDADRSAAALAVAAIASRQADRATRSAPIIQAMAKAEGKAKVTLLGMLSNLGGDPALQAVKAALAGDAEVRKAAIRAMSDWTDPAPMADLLAVAKEEKDNANQILALRGYIRMVGLRRGQPGPKLAGYQAALPLVTRPDEKKLILTGLGDIGQVNALKLVEPYLEDASVKREAFAAYGKIAESLAGRQPEVAKPALELVQEKAPDARARDRAKAALEKIK